MTDDHASILHRYGDYNVSKLRLADLEGQRFTAHARCHVTCSQGIKNNHIFIIFMAILSLHYTTFMGLR